MRRLFITYGAHTKVWTIWLEYDNVFVEGSMFTIIDVSRAYLIAQTYIEADVDLVVDPSCELTWRQLGLKAAQALQ